MVRYLGERAGREGLANLVAVPWITLLILLSNLVVFIITDRMNAALVAECADELERAGLPAIAVTRRLASERARALAFAPLADRLADSAN